MGFIRVGFGLQDDQQLKNIGSFEEKLSMAHNTLTKKNLLDADYRLWSCCSTLDLKTIPF